MVIFKFHFYQAFQTNVFTHKQCQNIGKHIATKPYYHEEFVVCYACKAVSLTHYHSSIDLVEECQLQQRYVDEEIAKKV